MITCYERNVCLDKRQVRDILPPDEDGERRHPLCAPGLVVNPRLMEVTRSSSHLRIVARYAHLSISQKLALVSCSLQA